jgi:hypothetical protein
LLFSLIIFDQSTQQKTFEELGNHTNSFKTTSEGLQKKSRQNRNKNKFVCLKLDHKMSQAKHNNNLIDGRSNYELETYIK